MPPRPAPTHRSRWIVERLRSSDGSLDTGITNALDKRLEAHSAATASRYTRSRSTVTIVHTEPLSTALLRGLTRGGLRGGRRGRLPLGGGSDRLGGCIDGHGQGNLRNEQRNVVVPLRRTPNYGVMLPSG